MGVGVIYNENKFIRIKDSVVSEILCTSKIISRTKYFNRIVNKTLNDDNLDFALVLVASSLWEDVNDVLTDFIWTRVNNCWFY